MARLTKNYCDYFPHDADMRNHPKVKAIRNKFKENGYSIWSMLLEFITGADGNVFEYSDMQFELLAGDFGFSATEIRDVVDYCIRLEMLFNKEGFIHSESLDEKLAPVYEKRGKAKQISKKQSRKSGKFVSDKPSDSVKLSQNDTEMPQTKLNKTKENKIELNKTTDISEASSLFSDCNEVYNLFCLREIGVKGEFDGLQGKSMKGIIELLRQNVKDKTAADEVILNSWQYILDNYQCWEPFHRSQMKLNQIRSNLLNIIKSIKNSSDRKPMNVNNNRESMILEQLKNEQSPTS